MGKDGCSCAGVVPGGAQDGVLGLPALLRAGARGSPWGSPVQGSLAQSNTVIWVSTQKATSNMVAGGMGLPEVQVGGQGGLQWVSAWDPGPVAFRLALVEMLRSLALSI